MRNGDLRSDRFKYISAFTMKKSSCLFLLFFVAFFFNCIAAVGEKGNLPLAKIKIFTLIKEKKVFAPKAFHVFNKKKGKKIRGLSTALIYITCFSNCKFYFSNNDAFPLLNVNHSTCACRSNGKRGPPSFQ